jgi:hypothetical protein
MDLVLGISDFSSIIILAGLIHALGVAEINLVLIPKDGSGCYAVSSLSNCWKKQVRLPV